MANVPGIGHLVVGEQLGADAQLRRQVVEAAELLARPIVGRICCGPRGLLELARVA